MTTEEIFNRINELRKTRLKEYAEYHFKDSIFDVNSDNYDWKLETLEQTRKKVEYFYKELSGYHSYVTNSFDLIKELVVILDLMNALFLLFEKTELENKPFRLKRDGHKWIVQ